VEGNTAMVVSGDLVAASYYTPAEYGQSRAIMNFSILSGANAALTARAGAS
jgi:hypothetical protein